MSAERILIDTSVWIAYFRNQISKVADKVDQILTEDKVFVPKSVIAELMQGAKSEKELSVIRDFLDAFEIIDQKEGSWIEAGKLAQDLKNKGKTIHLLDCYIAVIAREFKCKIFTLNSHFKEIQKILKISLIL
jgi:predicted nucleic acid-binding protein